jgi:hypothetical protein
LKTLGDFTVAVKLHKEVSVPLKVTIQKEVEAVPTSATEAEDASTEA